MECVATGAAYPSIILNPFEALAANQLSAATKRKHKDAERRAAKSIVLSEAEAPMKMTAMEEARDERNAQVARYNRHKADERDALLNGPWGNEFAPLHARLKDLDIDSAGDLVAAVLGAEWISKTDLDTRRTILSMIADAIIGLRIRNGLSPFDDAIGDEPPTAFAIIRKGMFGV